MNAAIKMKIMICGDKFDKDGNKIFRKGVPVQTWIEYQPIVSHSGLKGFVRSYANAR